MAEVKRHSLVETMNEIMRTQPVLNLATVSSEGRPHSSAMWFAADDSLDHIYWLSAADRLHSRHIDDARAAGEAALVSGSIYVPSRPSQPVLGMAFEGTASRLEDQEKIEAAVGLLVARRVFFPDEAANYLVPHETSTVATHGVYEATVTEWTHFDGFMPGEDRKEVFAWPPSVQK